jgi:hypothetical protein
MVVTESSNPCVSLSPVVREAINRRSQELSQLVQEPTNADYQDSICSQVPREATAGMA